jgi:hypothetical protein
MEKATTTTVIAFSFGSIVKKKATTTYCRHLLLFGSPSKLKLGE